MHEAGSALMGVGTGTGENRAVEAAKAAITSPLIEEQIEGAKGMLLNVTGGEDLGLFEVNEAADSSIQAADTDANIVFGAVVDPSMHEEVRVTVIATGFEGFETLARKPIQVRERGAASAARRRLGDRERRDLQVSDDDIDVPDFLRSEPVAAARADGRSLRAVEAHRDARSAPRSTTRTSPRARSWSRSRAGRCRSSTRACGRAPRRARPGAGSSTSRTWARSRPTGRRRSSCSSALLSNDVAKIEVGGAQYSCLCREDGGVLDDLFTYRLADDRYLTVTNAANHERDFAWFREHADGLRRRGRATRIDRLRDARGAGARGARDRRRARRRRAAAARCRTGDARGRRRRGPRLRHRLHGRGRRRGPRRARGARRRSGTRCSTAARRPPGSAPATPCGSRSASTSTATT